MIIQLFIIGIALIIFGIISLIRKKAFLGWFLLFMGIMINLLGGIVVYLYPHTLPF